MRDFTASGLWFLSDDPKNQVAGTLRYSEHGLRLKLLGGFRGGWSPKSEPYPIIQGIVGKNPYGEFITLVDCFTIRRRMASAGIGSETIHCNRGIAGDTHLNPDYDEFESFDVKVSCLDDWFGRKGATTSFLPDGGFGLDVSYRKPAPVRIPIGEATLTLGMAAWSRESARRVVISEEARIHVESLPRLTSERIQAAYVRPLQNLLSLATDTPNAVDDIELHGQSAGRSRKYHLLYQPISRLARKKDRLTDNDMLFTFDEAQEAGLNIFDRWLRFSESHEAFCSVYFASLYAPPRFLDEKFLRLMSAFKLLTASLGEVPRRTVQFLEEVQKLAAGLFSEEERPRLEPVLPTGPEIEMPSRLLALLEEHRSIMAQVIGEDFSSFVTSVLNTLAFAERRTVTQGRTLLQGEDLLDAMQRIHILIKLVLLKQLGFDEGQIRKFVERNKNFVYMRSM